MIAKDDCTAKGWTQKAESNGGCNVVDEARQVRRDDTGAAIAFARRGRNVLRFEQTPSL